MGSEAVDSGQNTGLCDGVMSYSTQRGSLTGRQVDFVGVPLTGRQVGVPRTGGGVGMPLTGR